MTWREPSRHTQAMLTFSFQICDASPGRKVSSVGIIASMLEDPSASGSLEGQGKLVVEVSAESESRNSSCSGTKWLCWDTAVEVMLLPATRANRRELWSFCSPAPASWTSASQCQDFSISRWQNVLGKVVCRFAPIALSWAWSWEKMAKYLTVQPILLGAGPQGLRLHILWSSSNCRKTEQILPLF